MIVDILNRIHKTGVISILRGVEPLYLKDTLNALYAGGIRCVEITLNTKGATQMIAQTKELFGDRFLVGAGTVLNEIAAQDAITAGADFILAPTLSTKVIELCNGYDKLAVPGVFTPTEVQTARQAGALLIKVFPVSTVGPQYIKDLLGPLDNVNLLPVGGVCHENARAYMEAGAFAIGVGSCLVNPKQVTPSAFEAITQNAAKLIAQVGGIK